MDPKFGLPSRGGGGTSLWVRRGCAPVLDSFWPENSGIGVSFYWKISVIGVYFHSEFSGIGVYCYTQILYKLSSNTWSVSGELISSIFVLKNVLRSEPRSNGHLEPNTRSQPSIPYPFDVELFLLFLRLGINI